MAIRHVDHVRPMPDVETTSGQGGGGVAGRRIFGRENIRDDCHVADTLSTLSLYTVLERCGWLQ